MKYLIDTQILLWIFSKSNKLAKAALRVVEDEENELFVSTVSFWEIAIKSSLGKLSLPFSIDNLASEAASNNIFVLHIKISHTLKVADLPHHHKDPFDRLIISQSIVENLPIISSDDKFSEYKINRVWR